MKRTIGFGKIDFDGCGRKVNEVTVDIELSSGDKPVLSIDASVWNNQKTDVVACGQCFDRLLPFFRDDKVFKELFRLWCKCHLNDMHFGTPEQENWLMSHGFGKPNANDYDKHCEALKNAGLYEIKVEGKPFKYGHEWLYWPIEASDMASILSLINDGTVLDEVFFKDKED